MTSLVDQARNAARMTREHPGVADAPVRFFARLAAWRLLTAARRDAIVTFERYGVRFYCPAEWRGMSKMAYTLRDHYEPELPHLARFVHPGDLVVDVGAHYGAYTLPLASLVGLEGQVIAVEPAAHALQILHRNIALNGLGNVDVLPVGLGAREGSGQLHLHGDISRASLNQFEEGADGATGEEAVRIARLDDLVPVGRPVGFIKIDIEGYELPALRGAARILRDRPVVLFELQPNAAARAGLPPYGVWDFLRESGYRFEQLMIDGRWMPVETPDQSQSANLVALPI